MSYIFSRNFAGSSIPAPLPGAPPTEAQTKADQTEKTEKAAEADEAALLAEEAALKQQLDEQQVAGRQVLEQQNDEQRVAFETQIEEGRSSDNKLMQSAVVLAGLGFAGVVVLLIFKKIVGKTS